MTPLVLLLAFAPPLALLLSLACGAYPGEERLARARRFRERARLGILVTATPRLRLPPPPTGWIPRPLLLATRAAGRAPPGLRPTSRRSFSSFDPRSTMSSRPRSIAALAALTVLAAPAAAQAHVTVQPATAQAGTFTVENIRVPNESDEASTTKVVVQLPDGFYFASYQAVPGWSVKVEKEKLDAPVTIEEGFEVSEQVTQVAFTADSPKRGIQPGAFQDFPLSVMVPDKEGESLTFKAVQTYSDGEVARWIGAEDADKPAPQLKVIAAEKEAGHGAAKKETADTAATVAATPVATTGADEGTDGLTILALAIGGLGLLAGLAGLGAARRARA